MLAQNMLWSHYRVLLAMGLVALLPFAGRRPPRRPLEQPLGDRPPKPATSPAAKGKYLRIVRDSKDRAVAWKRPLSASVRGERQAAACRSIWWRQSTSPTRAITRS